MILIISSEPGHITVSFWSDCCEAYIYIYDPVLSDRCQLVWLEFNSLPLSVGLYLSYIGEGIYRKFMSLMLGTDLYIMAQTSRDPCIRGKIRISEYVSEGICKKLMFDH